jgi:hypothetical protein
MEQVIKFQANDGTIFDTEKEARQHEKMLEIWNMFYTILDDHYYYNCPVSDLVDGLMENLDEIKSTLRRKK